MTNAFQLCNISKKYVYADNGETVTMPTSDEEDFYAASDLLDNEESDDATLSASGNDNPDNEESDHASLSENEGKT